MAVQPHQRCYLPWRISSEPGEGVSSRKADSSTQALTGDFKKQTAATGSQEASGFV